MTAVAKEEMKQVAATTSSSSAPTPKITTVEWILWKHHLGQRAKSDLHWKNHTSEVAHFFAHHEISDTNNNKELEDHPHQAFHIDLHHLPVPSKSFFLKTTLIHEEHRTPKKHTEYSLFKKGVFPDWEDPNCQGELYAKHYFPPDLLDQYWQQLVQGVLEGPIDINHEHVVGIRIVDKSKGKHPLYKLELWLNTTDQNIRNQIRKQAMDHIQQDEHYHFKLHWREFSTTTEEDADHEHGHVDPHKQEEQQAQAQQTNTTSATTNEAVPPPPPTPPTSVASSS